MHDIAQLNPLLQLLTADQLMLLLANGRSTLRHGWFGSPDVERKPVALLRCSCGSCYLISEIDPTEPDIMYGLYEDAEGVPTLDTVDLDALWDSGEGTDHVFARVASFVPTGTILDYWRLARKSGSVDKLFRHLP